VAGFVKGDVVIVGFPFTDLTQTKRRPTLILAAGGGQDSGPPSTCPPALETWARTGGPEQGGEGREFDRVTWRLVLRE